MPCIPRGNLVVLSLNKAILFLIFTFISCGVFAATSPPSSKQSLAVLMIYSSSSDSSYKEASYAFARQFGRIASSMNFNLKPIHIDANNPDDIRRGITSIEAGTLIQSVVFLGHGSGAGIFLGDSKEFRAAEIGNLFFSPHLKGKFLNDELRIYFSTCFCGETPNDPRRAFQAQFMNVTRIKNESEKLYSSIFSIAHPFRMNPFGVALGKWGNTLAIHFHKLGWNNYERRFLIYEPKPLARSILTSSESVVLFGGPALVIIDFLLGFPSMGWIPSTVIPLIFGKVLIMTLPTKIVSTIQNDSKAREALLSDSLRVFFDPKLLNSLKCQAFLGGP